MGEFSDFYIVTKMAKKAKKKTSKKKKKGGLPAKYAKMGFAKGWEEYKKTKAYKKKHAKATKPKATKKPKRKRAKTKAKRTKKPRTKARTKAKKRRKRARKGVTRAVGSLNAMASKGAYKLRAKKDLMASNWKGARGKMKSNYGALPFGPKTKASYRRGVDKAKYNPPNAKKWERNWKQGVRQ